MNILRIKINANLFLQIKYFLFCLPPTLWKANLKGVILQWASFLFKGAGRKSFYGATTCFSAVKMRKNKNPLLQSIKLLAVCLCLLGPASCGGGGEHAVTGPGLVGLDDTTSRTAPLLTVKYESSTGLSNTVSILSDLQSDGDIGICQ